MSEPSAAQPTVRLEIREGIAAFLEKRSPRR